MRWREFETLIGRAFELQGYHMNEAGAAGSDASIDLLMRKERQTYLVHCKTWRADKVGVEVTCRPGRSDEGPRCGGRLRPDLGPVQPRRRGQPRAH